MLEGGSNCGKFEYLAEFAGRNALVSTLDFCSLLGYICLWLTFASSCDVLVNSYNLVHVPISLRARTSALDGWL